MEEEEREEGRDKGRRGRKKGRKRRGEGKKKGRRRRRRATSLDNLVLSPNPWPLKRAVHLCLALLPRWPGVLKSTAQANLPFLTLRRLDILS